MVTITEARAANTSLSQKYTSLTAVFFGATSGIGEGTLRALAKHIPTPTVYIVGRSATAAAPLLSDLRAINPQGTFTFIEGDIWLLRGCDVVCEEIKRRTSVINLLYQSQGYVSYAGREENADGLDNSMALRYYTRIHIMQSLLPLLSSPLSRVINILAAGKESRPITTDLDLKTHYSVLNAASHTATMTTLAMRRLAAENPDVEFVHAFPGLVKTGVFLKGSGPWVRFLMGWVFLPVVAGLFAISVEEAGERQLFNATAELGYVREGKGLITLDSSSNGTDVTLMEQLEREGVQDAVWDFTQDIFKRARA